MNNSFLFRVWSKKYPIQIRTNTRKPRSSPETSRKMAASASDNDLHNLKDNDEDSSKASDTKSGWSTENENDEANNFDDIMFDAKEDLSEIEEKSVRKSSSSVRRRKNATSIGTGCEKKVSPTNSNSEKNEDAASSFVVVPEEETNKTFYFFTR